MSHFVAPAAWGARNGPRLMRRALDRGQHLRVVVPALVFAVVFSGLGVVGAALGQPFLLLLMGLPAIGAAQMTSEGCTRWWWARHRSVGPVVATAPTGVPATAWIRSRASLVTPVVLVVLLWAWAAGLAVAGLVHDATWVVAVAAVIALLPLHHSLALALGRVDAGGLFLTEAGIVHRWWTTTTELPWDAAERLRPVTPLALPEVPGSTRVTRSWRGWDWTDSTDRVGRGLVAVPAAYLTDPLDVVVTELRDHAHDPARRRHLGTQRSVDWARRPR